MHQQRIAARWLPWMICGAFLATSALADTVAYWRHEEGPIGADVDSTDPNAVKDSSGNLNFMVTFNEFTGATYVDTVSPVPLRSGLPNTSALDFDLDEDGGGPDLNDDNFTDLQFIESTLFNQLTIEFAFQMETIGGFQALFTKDGQPIPSLSIPPFTFKVRGDAFPGGVPNQFNLDFIDGDGDEHNMFSGFTIQAGVWYHVAFTLTSDTAQLYIAEGTGDYVLIDEISGEDFASPSGEVLIDSIGSFAVGRGMFGGGVADWCDAIIDEVRIDDRALDPNEFLFDRPVGVAADDDGDGVPNFSDVCPDTPFGVLVDFQGRPIGDLNDDCVNDMFDFGLYQQGFTGPAPS